MAGGQANSASGSTRKVLESDTQPGRLLRTSNGGVSWEIMPYLGPTLRRVLFVDSTSGFAAGDAGMLFYTDDGGVTWTQASSTCTNENLYALSMDKDSGN